MNTQFFSGVKRFIRDEEGAAAVEYGLLVALIAVVIVVAVSAVGSQVCQTFRTIAIRLGWRGQCELPGGLGLSFGPCCPPPDHREASMRGDTR